MTKPLITIPSDSKFKGAAPVDQNFQISLEDDYRPLIEGDRSVPLNLAERFNKERQSISTYRIYGKLQPYIDNAYSGTAFQNASTLIYNLVSLGPIDYNTQPVQYRGYPDYMEFDFLRSDVDDVIEDSTNWNLYISVPTTCNATQQFTYQPPSDGSPTLTFLASDGIPFTVVNVQRGGKNLVEFHCPVEHGLKMGEYVKIFISGWNFPNGEDTYPLYSVGNGEIESHKYIFSLYIPSVTQSGGVPNGEVGYFKRQLVIGDSTSISSYYTLENEIISNVEDYVLNKCGFAEGIFNNNIRYQPPNENPSGVGKEGVRSAYPTYLYSFIKDIDVKAYRDNLNRPISTLYVTIMLRNNKGYFNYPPTYGWSWNFPYSYIQTMIGSNPVVRGSANDPQPVSGIILPDPPNPNINSGKPLQVGDKLRGSFMEYNKHELKERHISSISHSFTFNSNVFTGSEEGYVYKPHHPIEIRAYSDYIETGDPNTVVNIPGYSTYFDNEKIWKWRDLYDIGFVEGDTGVDYPFLNNSHYPKLDIDFFVHRGNRSLAFSDTISASTTTLENYVIDGCE